MPDSHPGYHNNCRIGTVIFAYAVLLMCRAPRQPLGPYGETERSWKTAEACALAQELLNYALRIAENGADRYCAFRVGTRDELVTALGLAVHSDPPTSLDE